MKNATPNQIVALASASLAIITLFILFALKNYFDRHLEWYVIIIPPLVIVLFGYLIFHYFLEHFIYRKIKIIYKTIHNLKSKKGSISEKIKLGEDLINKVENEVVEWAKDKSLEINQLKQVEVYRKEFLANVSHELKTPVFNIQGYIETLLDGAIKDEKVNVDYLKKASKNIDRLNAILNDLEIISLIEEGKLSLDARRFDIHELCKEVFSAFDLAADIKDIRLSFKEECNKAFFVNADRERIHQVLINLIDNSVKYGKQAGKTRIGFYEMGEHILTEVSDDGIGIDEPHLSRLFERFYRVDKSRSREEGGTGLGLAIVKHIIEAHSQNFNVRSTKGVGSTFGFTLEKG